MCQDHLCFCRILAAKAKSATVKSEQPPALANSCGPRLAPRLSSQGMIKQSLAARPKTVGATGHPPAFPTQPLPAGTSTPKSIAQPLVQNPLVPRKVPMHVERARYTLSPLGILTNFLTKLDLSNLPAGIIPLLLTLHWSELFDLGDPKKREQASQFTSCQPSYTIHHDLDSVKNF